MKRLFKILMWIFIVIFALVLIVALLNVIPTAPKSKNKSKFWTSGETLNIPHGGAKELYPENTKYSFDMTAEYGVFEIDLSMTKDGVLISHHDTNLASSLNIKDTDPNNPENDIINLTFQEVKNKISIEYNYAYAREFTSSSQEKPFIFDELKKAEYLPVTLEYMFQTYPKGLYILEIKDTTENSGEETFIKASNNLKELILDYEMSENVVVASFDDDVMAEFRSLDGTIPTALAWNETLMFIVQSALFVDFFYFPDAAVASIPMRQTIEKDSSTGKLLGKVPGFIRSRIAEDKGDYYLVNLGTKRIIDDLHRHGIAVVFWTVDDVDDMKLLIDLGADGIITDRPDLLENVLTEGIQ
ncbi:hypothetical protein LJC17_02040 [Acholeplasma sp. OttesenSCG-928-E16]|nr:hypothetical protein [Acholeplasma sp. OttesenSCG-928-E16]